MLGDDNVGDHCGGRIWLKIEDNRFVRRSLGARVTKKTTKREITPEK